MQSIANIGRFSDGDGKTVNNNAEESTKLFNISFCSLFRKKTQTAKCLMKYILFCCSSISSQG